MKYLTLLLALVLPLTGQTLTNTNLDGVTNATLNGKLDDDASATRAALGLGTAATINDLPTKYSAYVGGVDYTAVADGDTASAISIQQIISGTGSTVLSVGVSGSEITVTAGSTTLRSAVVTAVNATPAATALVTASTNIPTIGIVANVRQYLKPLLAHANGDLQIQDMKGIQWTNKDGSPSGSRIYNWEDHDADNNPATRGDEFLIESTNRIAMVWGENGALQLGLARSSTDKGIIYVQSRNQLTVESPLGKSYPIFFNAGTYGVSSEDHTWAGMQGKGTATGDGELVFFAGSTFSSLPSGAEGTMPEVAAITVDGFRDPKGNSPAFIPLASETTLACATTKAHQNHYVTLTANRTLAFSGALNGMHGTIIVSQDSTGSRALTLPANSAKQAGFALTTGAPYAVDKIDWTYVAGEYYFTIDKDFVLSLDVDASAFLTAASITPSTTEGIAVNNLVKQLKSDGVWDDLIAAYPVVGGNSTAHAQDLKGAYDATFGAGVTHSSDGVTGSATTTGWMDSGVSVATLNRRDDIGIYTYSKSSAWTDNGRLFGTSVTNGRLYVARSGTSFRGHGPCSGDLNTGEINSVTDYRGHYFWGRDSSSTAKMRFNTSAHSSTNAANTAPSPSITFLAMNDGTGSATRGSTPTNANLAFCAVTTAAIGADSAKWTAFTNAVTAFQTALGRAN